MSPWLSLLFWIVSGLLLAGSGLCLWHLRWAHRLPALEPPRGGEGVRAAPFVSVVLAARDEAARIERTLLRLLAQREAGIEVIVVDDRSTDGTGEILERMALQDPRIRPLHVASLPEDWLGKCHACHIGAAAAGGEWILFTDADCWLAEDALARALRVAEQVGVDHVTLTPGVVPATPSAAAWHLAYLLTVIDWISAVNRDQPRAHFGIGAFNLVRRDAYDACGGYESLRLTVVDDVKLGLLLRRAGFRTRGFIGGGDAECHWGTTLRDMVRIMEKNYFAAVDYRLGVVLASFLSGTLAGSLGIAGPFTGSLAGCAAAGGLLSFIAPAAVIARRLRWSIWPALLVPFVFFVLFYAVLNSALVTIRQGGIRWRDTFYPLDLLRRGNVR